MSMKHMGMAKGRAGQMESMDGAGRGMGGASRGEPILISLPGGQTVDVNALADALSGGAPSDEPIPRSPIEPMAKVMDGAEPEGDIPFRLRYLNWLNRKDPDAIEERVNRMPAATDSEMEAKGYIENDLMQRRKARGMGDALRNYKPGR